MELPVDSWNILISHLVGQVWALWLRKPLHGKWERKLGRLAFQQDATVCHLSLFLCLRQLQHKIDTGVLWPHWCDITENMCSWDFPVLFPAGCAGVAFTLMTEWVEVFLLDSYLLCCVFGALCLHLEAFNGHLNVPLLCQEWIPLMKQGWDCTAAGALLQRGHRVISSAHVLCTLRTGSWQRRCVDKQFWNQQISANETLFFPFCAAVMASNFLMASSFLSVEMVQNHLWQD